MRKYYLFISHSWSYSDQYERLLGLLRAKSYFEFADYSVPRDDPIHNARTVSKLRQAIRNKMAPCSVVLILAGVYATHSKWINAEIYLAERGFNQPKPIIAIAPWGSQRTSVRVKEAANKIVRMECQQHCWCDQGAGMTNDSGQHELLELYKLHAELADRVSQRREGANRLYAGLLTGFTAFAIALLRFGTGDVPMNIILFIDGAVGASLSVSWYVVIRSYRQLNTGKFRALHELEKKLPYPFFTREWELLAEGKDRSRYWKLTVVETGLPVTFLLLSCLLMAFSVGIIRNVFGASYC